MKPYVVVVLTIFSQRAPNCLNSGMNCIKCILSDFEERNRFFVSL